MPRRMDIELTSARPDGSWTWRAAGAREPKGVVEGSILPADVKVGDELKVEVEQEIDGITVQSVVHGRAKSDRDEVLELLPTEQPFEPVIQQLARRARDAPDDGRRDRRRDKRDGKRDGRPRREGDTRTRDERTRDDDRRDGTGDGRPPRERRDRTDRGERRERHRPSFTPPPELPQRPKPKRLRPGKARRSEVLASLPEEQRPIAELALQGMPAVRQRLKEENQRLASEGKAVMPEASVLKLAEELQPVLRVAEWLDRAEAASRQMEHLDLRDLRSVVAAADDPMVARDESTRDLATELKAALAQKQEQELQLWFGDIDAALGVGRVIRALRLSSQPPKAGVPFPGELAHRLVDAANASLTPSDGSDRWAAVLEAAAFSPVRQQITPTAPPEPVTDELRSTVTRLAPAIPQVATLFDIEVAVGAPMPKPLRQPPRPKPAKAPRKPARAPAERSDKTAAAEPSDTPPTPQPTDTRATTPQPTDIPATTPQPTDTPATIPQPTDTPATTEPEDTPAAAADTGDHDDGSSDTGSRP